MRFSGEGVSGGTLWGDACRVSLTVARQTGGLRRASRALRAQRRKPSARRGLRDLQAPIGCVCYRRAAPDPEHLSGAILLLVGRVREFRCNVVRVSLDRCNG